MSEKRGRSKGKAKFNLALDADIIMECVDEDLSHVSSVILKLFF
jgi:hypothetical protein